MSTSYPGALDSFSVKVDGVTDILAAHVNNLQDSVVAIETAVGITGGRPLVSAYVGTTVTNVTGDGTTYTIIFNTEIKDQNANYNNSTGVFTAPSTGMYLVNLNVLVAEIGSAHLQLEVNIVTSNRTYQIHNKNPYSVSSSGFCNWPGCAIVDMDASDTLTVTVKVTSGTKVVDVYGGSVYTYLMIYLLI
jgi:hypothetical protein